MKLTETNKLLNKFGKDVIQQSRSRLSKQGINASKDLYNSLGYESKVRKNSLEFSISAEDYLPFIDKGVSGTEKKYNTPFGYTNKKPPAKVFENYPKNKGFKARDRQGKFITNKQFSFIMQNHIFKNGIKPTLFFTKSFEQQYKKLPNELINAFGLDLDNFLTFSFK